VALNELDITESSALNFVENPFHVPKTAHRQTVFGPQGGNLPAEDWPAEAHAPH
jgi:hypothetical protein